MSARPKILTKPLRSVCASKQNTQQRCFSRGTNLLEKSLLQKLRHETLPKELAITSNSINASAAALTKICEKYPDSKGSSEFTNLKNLAASLSAHADKLQVLRKIYFETREAGDFGDGELFKGAGTFMKNIESTLKSMRSWQEALQLAELLHTKKQSKDPILDIFRDKRVLLTFVQLARAVKGEGNGEIPELWNAFLLRLRSAGISIRKLEEMASLIDTAEQADLDSKSILLRGWGEELLQQPLSWWALRKAWLNLRDLKLFSDIREYSDEDYEGWSHFQKRTGDMRIAAWELVMMKRNFDQILERHESGILDPVVGEPDVYVQQPRAIRRSRREFMDLRWLKRNGSETEQKSGNPLVWRKVSEYREIEGDAVHWTEAREADAEGGSEKSLIRRTVGTTTAEVATFEDLQAMVSQVSDPRLHNIEIKDQSAQQGQQLPTS